MTTLYNNFKKQLFEVRELEELREVLALIQEVKDDFKDLEYVCLMQLFQFKRIEITGKW